MKGQDEHHQEQGAPGWASEPIEGTEPLPLPVQSIEEHAEAFALESEELAYALAWLEEEEPSIGEPALRGSRYRSPKVRFQQLHRYRSAPRYVRRARARRLWWQVTRRMLLQSLPALLALLPLLDTLKDS